MRKLLLALSILFLSNESLAADASGERWRISVLATEISTSSNRPWSDDPHAGVGLGLAYTPAPQWDVELTVASQTHTSPYTRLLYFPLPDATPGLLTPVTEFREYRVTPLSLSATRHFLTDSVIAPYVRAGVRHVSAPDDPRPTTTFFGPLGPIGPAVPGVPNFVPISEGFGFDDRTSAEAGAGIRLRLTPRTVLRGEVNRLIRSDEVEFDPLTRFAVGLSWVF
jgi:hypothetical protein